MKTRAVYFAVTKKIIAVAVTLLLCGGLFGCRPASAGIGGFGLCLTDAGGAAGVEIRCFAHHNGEYYLFLPAGAYDGKTEFVCRAAGRVSVDGVAIRNGTPNDVITHDGVYTVACGDVSYTLNVLSSADLPALFIETESGNLEKIHADKDYKEEGRLRVFENGALSDPQELSSVKGRGNTTWEFDKKPYNIKFTEETPLLGMDAAKKWCLLANAADPSLIRTDIAFELAKAMGIEYVCDCRHADVYINGDYMGNYLVSEAVQVGPGRVEITDLDDLNEAVNPGADLKNCPLMTSGGETDCGNRRWTDIPVSPADISGGYLIEYDSKSSYSKETNGFITSGGQYVTVKSPERASAEEIGYISDYVNAAEEALLSENGYNAAGKHFSEYYDLPSLAKMYVLNEFLYNGSQGCSSTFFYKEAGGKLVAGPPWDFDESIDNPYKTIYEELIDPNLRCLIFALCNDDTMLPSVHSLAYRHEEFVRETASAWRQGASVFAKENLRAVIDAAAAENARSAVCDHFRWTGVVIQSPEEREDVYRERYVAPLYAFLEARTAFAEKEFSNDPALLFYDGGEVKCLVLENRPIYIGGQTTVKGIENSSAAYELPEGYRFREWNTEKDGGGESYQPGDVITLDRLCTVLYAQWDKDSP